MKKSKREKECSLLRGKLMSSNDHVKSWEKKMLKGDVGGVSGPHETFKGREREKLECDKPFKLESPRKRKNSDRSKVGKCQRKNAFSLELKPLRKSKTAGEAAVVRPEVERFQKASQKVRRKDSLVLCWERNERGQGQREPTFGSTWDHTNYSILSPSPSLLERAREKRAERKTRESKFWPIEEKGDDSDSKTRDKEPLAAWKKKTFGGKVFDLPFFDCFLKDRQKQKNVGGNEQAIIIYQRQNRNNYLNADHFSGDYQVEQISFAGSCGTTVDVTHSKRSLSEPRQKALKEFYVARRRTRLQIKPEDFVSGTSNIHSTIDFFQKREMTSELKKMKENGPEIGMKAVRGKSKSQTDIKTMSNKEEVTKRLQDTAQKKLDLHREMRRLEKMDRKNFWESIKESLNYRCALADMISTQSFISRNESAKFFSSTENSTEIFVREGIIEKISSYQEFHRFGKPTSEAGRHEAVGKAVNPKPGSGYNEMKTLLGTVLINEEEEEEKEERRRSERSRSRQKRYRGISRERVSSDTATTILPVSASEKLTMIESSLDDSSSELEFLMEKLSDEIRKCSELLKKIHNFDKCGEKGVEYLMGRHSASESELCGGEERRKNLGFDGLDIAAYPVLMFPALDSLTNLKPSPATAKFKNKGLFNEDKKSKKKSKKNAPQTSYASSDLDLKSSGKSDSSLKSFPSGTISTPEDKHSPKNRHISKQSHTTKESPKSNSAKKDQVPAGTCENESKGSDNLDRCCQDCRYLQRRILKLERDLEKIQNKMPFYPPEYQNSIKVSLEKLKATSETVLQKLRNCAKLRFDDHQFISKSRKQVSSKRTISAPEAVIKNHANKKLVMKSSGSDYNLNVGMAITMENVDPTTGEKLPLETSNATEQEGNIQCKVFRDGDRPLLVMDTDFSYNPHTGMLFKKKSCKSKSQHSVDIILPVTKIADQLPSGPNLNEASVSGKKDRDSSECTCHLHCRSAPGVSPAPPDLPESTCGRERVMAFDAPSIAQSMPDDVQASKGTMSLEYGQNNSGIQTPVTDNSCEIRCAVCAMKRAQRKKSKEKKDENLAKEIKSKSKMPACLFKKKESKSEKSVSRIPRRRKTTPSCARERVEATSPSCSVTSMAKSEASYADHSCTSEKSTIRLAKLFSFTWTFGFVLCKLVHYMQSVSAICSVLTLTTMSLERYYAIVHPMKAQYICTISQARRIITATWISSFFLAVPILFAQVHLRVGIKVEAYWCVRDWDNKALWRAHELYMMLLILVVPTGVMAVAYTAICCEIWEVIQRRQGMTSGKGHELKRKTRIVRTSSNDSFPSSIYTNNSVKMTAKKRVRRFTKRDDDESSVKQVIKMLVAVVVIYVLCWGPMLIDNVLQAYGILSHIRIGWLKYMGTAFHLMAYFNSCINPIIYGFMSKNFRESFMKALCCRGNKPKMALRSFSLSQTRNTSIRYAESSLGRTVSMALPV